jgi:hypothetical protein
MSARTNRLACVGVLALTLGCRSGKLQDPLGPPEHIADGVEFYRSTDSSLVNDEGPIAVYLLKLDLSRVRLASVLAGDEISKSEPVDAIAQRHGAIAAVNGGYFNRQNGDPQGLLKVAGQLVSDATVRRGAVIIDHDAQGRPTLWFDRLAAKMTLSFQAKGRTWTVPIDGVDTTRARGKLMLYTPPYHSDTDTAPTGTEWVLDGQPLRVTDVRANFGHTRIPRQGAVLSYGGIELPEALQALVEEVRVHFDTSWRSTRGLSPEHLDQAESIVNGAGLLRQGGQRLTDWQSEGLKTDTFVDVRDPRTVIGLDDHGAAWLAVADGRQPSYSVGMTFADLQRLGDCLHLTDELNLDGGGSSTIVINGRIVNRPSDPAGPRPVSDAVVVLPRAKPESQN